MGLKYSKVCTEHNDTLPCRKSNSEPCKISTEEWEIKLVLKFIELRKKLGNI